MSNSRSSFKNIINSAGVAEKMQKMKKRRSKADRFKYFKEYYHLYRIMSEKKVYPLKFRAMAMRLMEKKHLKGLNEAVEAALDSTVHLNPEDVKLLKRTRAGLRDFKSMKREPMKQKKLLLQKVNQKGGFLPFLIPIIAGLASTLVGEGVHEAVKAIKNKHKKKH